MKTVYEYVRFEERAPNPKTKIWSCLNRSTGDDLGLIKWYARWRCYCYFTIGQAIYSAGCLDDIAEFLAAANKERPSAAD